MCVIFQSSYMIHLYQPIRISPVGAEACRLGTPVPPTRGFGADDPQIGTNLIIDVREDPGDETAKSAARERVSEL